MSGSIPVLYPQDASSTPLSRAPKTIFRHCQASPGGLENPALRTTEWGCVGRFRTLDSQHAMTHWPKKGLTSTHQPPVPSFHSEGNHPKEEQASTHSHTACQGLLATLPALTGTSSAQIPLGWVYESTEGRDEVTQQIALFPLTAAFAKRSTCFRIWPGRQ